MATISSAGIGSGLDVNGIVSQLMAVERQPLASLQAASSKLTTKISAFGKIQMQLATLADAAKKLATPGTWTATTAASSNPAAALVTSTGNATPSSFTLAVERLATAQSTSSATIAKDARFSAGTLQLQSGTWTGSDPARTFAPDGQRPAVTLDIAAGSTLSDIASQINTSAAGMTATVVNDGSGGQKMLLRSKLTGEVNGFDFTASDGGAAPAAGETALSSLLPPAGLTITYAADALATINGPGGIQVRSASNTLSDTVPGLTLQLLKPTDAASPAEISVGQDTASMVTAVTDFVTAYNTVNSTLAASTKFDPGTKVGALLQGDATAVGLQSNLRRLLGTSSGGAGGVASLSDIGVGFSTTADGSLSVDTAKLGKVLSSNPAAVRALFIGSGSGVDAASVGARIQSYLSAASGSDGTLAAKTTALQAQQKSNSRTQDRFNDRLVVIEARLRRQYASLDTVVSRASALNNYVGQQVAQWNRSNG